MKRALCNNLGKYPLVKRHLGSSLKQRLGTDTWYENRILRYLSRDSEFIMQLENTFSEAKLDEVKNSGQIFELKGIAEDYDNQLFDALAEVRLVRWARRNGYENITKLPRGQGTKASRLPDFSMGKNGEVVLAEAKHFRVRDYLLDFICDRLEGLALVTCHLSLFGLQVAAEDDYARKRDALIACRQRSKIVDLARQDLREGLLQSLESDLQTNSNCESVIQIIGIRFAIRRNTSPKRVFPSQIYWANPTDTFSTILDKLNGNLQQALRQIKDFSLRCSPTPSRALVFFSGASPEEWEWDVLLGMLNSPHNEAEWNMVHKVHCDAAASIGIPFDLIVRQRNPAAQGDPEYKPFPWNPAECSQG